MNFCFAGYGSIADVHAQTLKDEEDVVFHTVVGRLADSAAEFAEKYGFIRHMTDYDAAIANPDIDVVVITTPSEMHYEQTTKALKAGKHVLCEIPLAMNFAECQELTQMAYQAGKSLMVAHTMRFYRPFVIVKQMVERGELHIHHIVSRWFFWRRENVNWRGRTRSWVDNLLWHHACHFTDLSMWILDSPVVNAHGIVAYPSPGLGIPMDLNLSFRTQQDQIADIGMSYNCHQALFDTMFIGEEDSLLVDYWACRLTGKDGVIYDREETDDWLWQANRDQNLEFLAALREGRPPASSALDILPAMAVLQVVQEQFEAERPAGRMHSL